jgi:hypothetical protein
MRSWNPRFKRSKSNEYGGPSWEDANIIVIKESPGELTHAPCILFWIFALCSIMILY